MNAEQCEQGIQYATDIFPVIKTISQEIIIRVQIKNVSKKTF